MIKRFSRPAQGIGGIAEKGGAQRNLEVLEASGQGTFTRHHGRPLQLRGALGTAQERIRPIPDRKCGLFGFMQRHNLIVPDEGNAIRAFFHFDRHKRGVPVLFKPRLRTDQLALPAMKPIVCVVNPNLQAAVFSSAC